MAHLSAKTMDMLKMRKVHKSKLDLFFEVHEDRVLRAIKRADKYEMPGPCLEEWVTIQGA